MASRVVEVLYKLKDLFTPTAKKIEKSYDKLGKSAEEAAKSVEKTNEALEKTTSGGIAGPLGDLQQLGKIGKIAAGIGTAATAMAKLATSTIDAGKAVFQFNKSAQRIGVTAQELDDLNDIAVATNTEFSQLRRSVLNINKQLERFKQGNKNAADLFDRLRIDAEAFSQLDLAGKLERLSRAFVELGGSDSALKDLNQLIAGKTGTGLSLLITKGPAAVKSMAESAADVGALWNEEAIEGSERIVRSWNQLQSTLRTIGKNAELSLARFGGGFLEAINVGGDPNDIDQLKQEYAELQKAQDKYERSSGRIVQLEQELTGKADRRQERLAELEKAITDLGKSQDTLRESSAKLDRQEAGRLQNEEELVALEKEKDRIVDAYKDQTKQLQAELRKQTSEFQKARREQQGVEAEFAALVESITGPAAKTAETVRLGDVFGSVNQARAAADRGEFEDAVKLAQQGGDYLELLKEKGTETQGTLGFLAKQLQEVAVSSAKARAEAEQKDVLDLQPTLEALKKQSEAIEKQGEFDGVAYGRSFNAGARAEIAKLKIPAPEVAVASVRPAPTLTRQADGTIGASDGTDFRRTLDQGGGK